MRYTASEWRCACKLLASVSISVSAAACRADGAGEGPPWTVRAPSSASTPDRSRRTPRRHDGAAASSHGAQLILASRPVGGWWLVVGGSKLAVNQKHQPNHASRRAMIRRAHGCVPKSFPENVTTAPSPSSPPLRFLASSRKSACRYRWPADGRTRLPARGGSSRCRRGRRRHR